MWADKGRGKACPRRKTAFEWKSKVREPWGVFGEWQAVGIGWSIRWEVEAMRLEAGWKVKSKSEESLIVTVLRAFNFFLFFFMTIRSRRVNCSELPIL